MIVSVGTVLGTIGGWILGTLTNWTSTYTNPVLSKQVGRLWSWWLRRGKSDRRLQRERWVSDVASDDTLLILTSVKAQRFRSLSLSNAGFGAFIVFLLMFVEFQPRPGREGYASFIWPMVYWFPRALVTVSWILAWGLNRGAREIEAVVDEATSVRRRERSTER